MVSLKGFFLSQSCICFSDIGSMSPAYRGPDLYSGRGKTDAHARLSLRIQGSRSAEMSLRDELDERWRRMRERSPEIGQAYDALVQTLVASGLTETSLKAGERMPDFDLPNVEGRFVASPALLERGPLVVSFFRGGWCPFCTTELTALQQTVPGIAARGASLVAITPDTGAALAAAKRDNALAYQVLSDVDLGLGLQVGFVVRVPDPIRDLYRRP